MARPIVDLKSDRGVVDVDCMLPSAAITAAITAAFTIACSVTGTGLPRPSGVEAFQPHVRVAARSADGIADSFPLAGAGVTHGVRAAPREFVNRSLPPGPDLSSIDSVPGRSGLTGTVAATGALLFDADVAHRGLSAYASVTHPEDITIVNDPILGTRRKVMKFTVQDSDIGPTANPRAQVETAQVFGTGSDIYIGWSTLFPSSWPDALPGGGQSWLTLEEVYGPPWAGASPVKIGMRSGAPALTFQRNSSYGWDVPWEQGPIVKNRWYDFVIHERLSSDARIGSVEFWTSTGAGWKQQLLGAQTKLFMRTLDSSNDRGPNYSALKLYRLRGMYDVLTVFHAGHRVGTSFDVVAPHSYGY